MKKSLLKVTFTFTAICYSLKEQNKMENVDLFKSLGEVFCQSPTDLRKELSLAFLHILGYFKTMLVGESATGTHFEI